jgi:hypothetical protein
MSQNQTESNLIDQISDEAGVDRITAANWVEQMKARVPSLLDRGLSIPDAFRVANDEIRAAMIEFAEGTTPRARVSRSYVSSLTYARLGGLGYVLARDGSPEEYAVHATVNDDSLSDLNVNDVHSLARSLAGN